MTERERILIDEIAGYVVPLYPVEGRGKMVPADIVTYLQGLARTALKPMPKANKSNSLEHPRPYEHKTKK